MKINDYCYELMASLLIERIAKVITKGRRISKMHIIKLNENFVTPVLNGEKTFEIRINDRGYNKGDIIQFIIVDNDGNRINGSPFSKSFELEKRLYEITYVLSGFHIDKEYVVFSFKEYSH